MKFSAKTEEKNIAKQNNITNHGNFSKKKEKCRKKAEVKSMAGADEPKTTGQSDNNPKVNVHLGTTITLFNRELALVYEKNGDVNSFILIPTKMDTEGITFDEMTADIKKLFSDEPNSQAVNIEELTNTIKTDEQKKNARFKLTMAYLYFEFSTDMTERKKVEFAFQITVTGIDSLIPNLNNNLFNIKDVQLAIWSTNRQKIIDAMHLISPKQFIDKQE